MKATFYSLEGESKLSPAEKALRETGKRFLATQIPRIECELVSMTIIKSKLEILEKWMLSMDKKIRQIEKKIKKDTKGEEKELKTLEKADKKRDKECEYGEKMMNHKKVKTMQAKKKG